MENVKRFKKKRNNYSNSKVIGRDVFLRKLFQRCKGEIELRAIGDEGRVKSKFIPLADDWNFATKLIDEFCNAHKGWNLYFGVATKDGKSGRKGNTVNISCTWADIDYKTIPRNQFEEKLSKFPFKPTIIVSSGNGQHLYFLLDQQVDKTNGGNIEMINDWIATELGGDNVKDIARIMRLPGTVNHKYEDKPICIVKAINRNTYTLNQFLGKVPKKKKLKIKTLPAKKLPPDILEEQIKYISKQIVDKEIIISQDDTYQDWLNVAFALIDGLGEKGREYFHLVSSASPKYVEREADEQYDRCLKSDEKTKRTKKTPIAFLIKLAQDAGIRIHKGLRNEREFTEKGKCIFNPILEANIFIEDDNKKFIIYGKQLLMYESGYYQLFKDEYYLKLLEEQIEFVFEGRVPKAKEILERVKHHHSEKKEQDVNINPKLLNVKNGLLDIDTMKLQPHSSDLVYTYQIPVKYNPDAKCRRWKKFLKEVLVKEESLKPDKELIRIVKRFVGYCLYPKIPIHEALIFWGKGSNGKTVLCDVIEALISPELTSSVDFGKIGKNTFASSRLVGKMLNISYDFSGVGLGDGDIKAIISGDPIDVERKNEQGFKYTPIAKHIICVNTLPYSKDKSYGFFRRFNIIPFHAKFTSQLELNNMEEDDEKDICRPKVPNLQEKIIKEELEGILLWAIDGLKRLLEAKEFPYSKQVQKLKNVFKIRSSAVEMFFEERVTTTDDVYEEKEKFQFLYQIFLDYCREHKIPPVSVKKFGIEVDNLGLQRVTGTSNVRYIQGVKYNMD